MAATITAREALKRANSALSEAGISAASHDARVLLEHVSGIARADLLRDPDITLGESEYARFSAAVNRRVAREPLQRIIGSAPFFGREFVLNEHTLVPRQDSETLIEAVLGAIHNSERPRILDLGTGSGCLLITLLAERPSAFGVGVDRSFEAILAARENSRTHAVSKRSVFFVGDWMEALTGKFDAIVSNPPYVRSAEIGELEPEVSVHEPILALDGGADGLVAYRRIVADAASSLAPGGLLAVETGSGQAQEVSGMFSSGGLVNVGVREDLSGHQRCVFGSLPRR